MMAFPVVWAPVSDFMYVKNPFFEQDPVELMVTGQFNKVPTMIGTVKDEGLLHTATLMQNSKVRIIYCGLDFCPCQTLRRHLYQGILLLKIG